MTFYDEARVYSYRLCAIFECLRIKDQILSLLFFNIFEYIRNGFVCFSTVVCFAIPEKQQKQYFKCFLNQLFITNKIMKTVVEKLSFSLRLLAMIIKIV